MALLQEKFFQYRVENRRLPNSRSSVIDLCQADFESQLTLTTAQGTKGSSMCYTDIGWDQIIIYQ